jgi:hypothetical protein
MAAAMPDRKGRQRSNDFNGGSLVRRGDQVN